MRAGIRTDRELTDKAGVLYQDTGKYMTEDILQKALKTAIHDGIEKMITHAQFMLLIKRCGWPEMPRENYGNSQCSYGLCNGDGYVFAERGIYENAFRCPCPVGRSHQEIFIDKKTGTEWIMRLWGQEVKDDGFKLKWADLREEKISRQPVLTMVSAIAEQMEM